MKANFVLCSEWATIEGRKALAERRVHVGNGLDRTFASLEYPTLALDCEAWLVKNDDDELEPVCVRNEDNGAIWFSVFVCVKGYPKYPLHAEEDGLAWESLEYADHYVEANINDIDFSAIGWEDTLKTRLEEIAERFVGATSYTLDKPNY